MKTLFVFSVVSIVIFWVVSNLHNITVQRQLVRERLFEYIQQLGGTNIKIEPLSGDRDRDNISFFVSFLTADGLPYTARCKVSFEPASRTNDNPFYWVGELPLPEPRSAVHAKEEIIGNLVYENERLNQQLAEAIPVSPTSSSKEQIITDLMEQNGQLQAELDQLRQKIA